MSKNKLPPGAFAKQLAAWRARGKRIIQMYEKDDLSFAKIGAKIGVSSQRATQLYHLAKARESKAAAKRG